MPLLRLHPDQDDVSAAEKLREGRLVDGHAGTSTVTPDWKPVADRIRDQATDDWNDQVTVDRLEAAGGTFARGRGRITAPGTVTVTGPDGTPTTYVARRESC